MMDLYDIFCVLILRTEFIVHVELRQFWAMHREKGIGNLSPFIIYIMVRVCAKIYENSKQ